MKRKIVAILTGLLISTTAASGLPAVTAMAATLADGTEAANAVPVAGFVKTGTTPQVMVLDTAGGEFHVILDKNTVFNNVGYLTPTDSSTPAGQRDIVVCDIYLDSSNNWHAADFQQSVLQAKSAKSVEIGTAKAQDTAKSSASTEKGNTTGKANVKVVQTVPVEGTVDANSTSDTLYLSTTSGTMVFKLDSTTDMSNGKVLIPGYKYRIEFYNGGDGYNHVARVIDQSGNNVGTGNGVSSTTYNVPGTVKKGTIQNTLYLSTTSGDMTIKIDATTDTSACHILKEGQKVTVVCASGPDRFLHALKLTDGTPSESTEGSMGDKGMLTNQVTQHVYGTFSSDSTDDIAIMGVNGNNMKLRLDSGSKGSNVPAIVPGWSYSAEIYYGTDGYYHIQSFREEAGHPSATNFTLNEKSAQTFTGTIQKDTVANLLSLKLSDGSTAKIKLDVNANVNGARVLRTGRKVKVDCFHGSDGYWHANKITKG